MNPEHENLIRSNLTELASCTTNFDDLVRELVQSKTITISDKELLQHIPVSKIKFTELYLLLFRKGSKAFENLLTALRSTDNDAAYNLLTEQRNVGVEAGAVQVNAQSVPVLQYMNGSDFVVQPEHINEISSILENSTTLRSNWNTIRRQLLRQRDLNELEADEALREPGFYEILVTTLQRWIEANGNQALFETLLSTLRSRGETRIADDLSRAQVDILGRTARE